MRTESTYRSVVNACHAASCEIYSTTLLSDGWLAEIEFDNLLHDGHGESEVEALTNALTTILNETRTPASPGLHQIKAGQRNN